LIAYDQYGIDKNEWLCLRRQQFKDCRYATGFSESPENIIPAARECTTPIFLLPFDEFHEPNTVNIWLTY
jgi:hypothetical protein